jgi:hypothetical protein
MRVFSVLLATGVALTLAGCGQSSSVKAVADARSSDCGTGPVSPHLVRTASFELAAAAGPLEATYTQAQVAAQHPKTGEMMISGDMMGDPGMPMNDGPGSGMASVSPTGTDMHGSPGSPAVSEVFRHVEVHICGRTSGRVVQNAKPEITLTDTSGSGSGSMHQLPIAVMQGVHSGVADMHYGNNAQMILGHHYSLDVAMRGEHATFDLGPAR